MILGTLVVRKIRILGDVAQVEFARPAELLMDGECQMSLLVKTIPVALLPVLDGTQIDVEIVDDAHLLAG